MVSVAEALEIGTRRHQAGQLAEAEQIYRKILAVEPDHPHALHQMGILAMQSKQFEAALELFQRALRTERSHAPIHANMGEAYRHLSRNVEAADCYRTALRLDPALLVAYTMLGTVLRLDGKLDDAVATLRQALRLRPDEMEPRTQLGHALLSQDKHDEAEACFRRVLRTDPNSALAHFNLGNCLQTQQRLAEAEAEYRLALQINPLAVDAHNNLGTVLKGTGKLDEAIVHFKEAIRLKPDCGAAHTNLGAAYFETRNVEGAIASYRAALAADPTIQLARQNLGTMLVRTGDLDEALACFHEVIRVDPKFALAYLGIANVYQLQRRLDDAIEYCKKTIELDPISSSAYNNMGVAWSDQGDRDQGIECLEKAIELNPAYGEAHGNLASSLQALGRLDEAIVHHELAVELASEDAGIHSNYLYSINYHPRYSPQELFEKHLEFGKRHADALTAAAAPHANDRTLDRRLRVGYSSCHFKDHAVNFFSEPILASHDHRQFEIFCYSDVDAPDPVTQRLRSMTDCWRDTAWLTDQQLSDQIRQDAIDILIDLTGHIAGGKRMLAFARKPAPVQVTYIGYQNTTGMKGMDYRLTDDYSDPPGLTDALHTERLARLPVTFFCYQPSSDAPPVNPPPSETNGYVTFGSMNNFSKVTPQVLAAWAQLLHNVAGSRLLIRADMTPWLRRHLVEVFAGHRIGEERLLLQNRVRRPEYLEMIRGFDIALDPFPFNGHTTTCDCLWQGVPVVTLSGGTYVSRFGGSGLVNMGLEDLIAHSTDEYVEIATRLALDADRRHQLRFSLRERMAASPLLDFAGFTRNLEAEYRRMWHRWCAEHPA